MKTKLILMLNSTNQYILKNHRRNREYIQIIKKLNLENRKG